jgi:hypothetical protein
MIQFWMLDFSGGCPAGWTLWAGRSPGVHSDCYINSNPAVVPQLASANLAQVQLWAQAGLHGGNDSVYLIICSPNCTASASAFDNKLDLASGWREAEFNVFGDGGASPMATFNTGSTLVVRLALDEGAKLAPSCQQNSFTAETNSLNLVEKPTVNLGQWPAIEFTMTNVPNTSVAACAFTAGEPHLQTFDGQLYDFQALGDFLLVEADPDFVVQTRQQRVNWPIPNVTANKAVATKMGGTRVAVCLDPARLEIDGRLVDLADGKSLSLPSGVSVLRSGNVYLIKGPVGETVRAAITNDDFINVDLDLGYARKKWVRGLLGNANGRTDDDIATRDGRVISQPVSFADLYGPYADSWRVPPDQSLLCRDNNIIVGVPDRPFYANDLDPADFKLGQETCKAAGVKAELLDACILDVGVLGQGAAEFFTRAPTPIAVMPRP